jgi:hypothetical protein
VTETPGSGLQITDLSDAAIVHDHKAQYEERET